MNWKNLLKAVMPALAALALVSACGGDDEEVKDTKKTEEKAAVTAQKIMVAERVSSNSINIQLKSKNPDISAADIVVREYGSEVYLPVSAVKSAKAGKEALVTVTGMAMFTNYEVGALTKDGDSVKTNYLEAQFGDLLWDSIYSDKALGNNMEGGDTVFRVFSPRAQKVLLCLFDRPYAETYGVGVPYPDRKDIESNLIQPKFEDETQIEMKRDANGVWEYKQKGPMWGKLYGYRVFGPKGGSEMFNPNLIVADPYSKAVATKQLSPQQQLTVIVDPSVYKWESKDKYVPVTRREAIIYEMHVRDLTMLSPDVKNKGTYEGLVEEGKTGGINHIKKLGVNIVELLPTQEFDEIEEPYSEKGYANKWNTYGRNHWGYMTSCFFAPEAFYYEGRIGQGKWIGVSGGQVYGFKKMVDTFHKNGIGVMMDVVYNHVSQYDRNALKYVDKKYYFWLNAQGADDAKSGCGNDYRTDRPMARRLIVDSTKYWVDEYHVDGFRFDLGTIIDWKTYETLIPAVRKMNPNCHLTAEPWMGGRGEPRDGGGYALNDNNNGFDKRDMGAWNDKVRTTIRQSALIFGKASFAELKTAVQVFPKLFKNPANSYNYMESHDNETVADFIHYNDKTAVKGKTEIPVDKYLDFCKLSESQLKSHKLGALFLLTLQGPIMLHEGQEFARAKVVFPPKGESVFPVDSADWQKVSNKWKDVKDGADKKWSTKAVPWTVDGDSYEKDNENNWINWKLTDVNKDLFEYYQGLIKIRKQNSAFAKTDPAKIVIFEAKTVDGKGKVKNAIGYTYDKAVSGDKQSFTMLVNGSSTDCTFDVPSGDWNVLADGTSASVTGKKVSGTVSVPAMSGMILAQ